MENQVDPTHVRTDESSDTKSVAYYTVINPDHYLDTKEPVWNWYKIMDQVNKELPDGFKAVIGTNCRNIENFLNAYNDKPTFVPTWTDYKNLTSGLLFMLKKEGCNCITDIYKIGEESEDEEFSDSSDEESEDEEFSDKEY